MWVKFFLSNKALIAVLAYFLCSAIWSPFPNPTLKRGIHNIGLVMVGLIIMTEKDPVDSLKVVFARVSFVLFPLSVIFIKYFPHIGRTVSSVSGVHMLSGVAGHKNTLGSMAMVFCLVLLWDLMGSKSNGGGLKNMHARLQRIISLSIGLYLLIICESATALMCFIIGVVLLFISKRLAWLKNSRQVLIFGTLVLLSFILMEKIFNISEMVISSLGRDNTFSGRETIWQVTLEKDTNYLIGHGLGAFWHTAQGESVWREIAMNPLSSAHSGFVETYLDGGTIGLFLLAAFICATGSNAFEKLVNGDPIGQLALIFWLLLLLNNVTESVFFTSEPLWFTMLLVTNDIPEDSKDVQDVHG